MGIFGGAHGWGGEGSEKSPLRKICRRYPTMMELGLIIPYLKKIQKINKSRYTHHEFSYRQHFFTGNQQNLLHQEIQI